MNSEFLSPIPQAQPPRPSSSASALAVAAIGGAVVCLILSPVFLAHLAPAPQPAPAPVVPYYPVAPYQPYQPKPAPPRPIPTYIQTQCPHCHNYLSVQTNYDLTGKITGHVIGKVVR